MCRFLITVSWSIICSLIAITYIDKQYVVPVTAIQIISYLFGILVTVTKNE